VPFQPPFIYEYRTSIILDDPGLGCDAALLPR
jgi:hypothetical protein